MTNNLNGSVVLITGGSRGIGLALAEEFLAQEATVVICGRKKENLDNAMKQLPEGENLIAVQAHIAKEEDVSILFDKIHEKYGRLDILINNAGMNIMTPSIIDTDLILWQKIIDSNLTGTYLCSKKAASIMKEQGSGKIINISSIAARLASPGMGIYGIAKSAIEMLTRVLAAELAFYNIQVNSVAPGMVRTDFSKPFWSNPDVYQEIIKKIPLGRIAEPQELVDIIIFLSSSKANYITGQTIILDGGATVI
jgi:NAD(P)-dependent dehydrogenase (short-subunit alcohol dehydrogenase family)